MLLNDLPTDVLWQIFALTDVYTILSLARVNRAFNEIASFKQLWLSVVRGLSRAQIIDAPGDETLETLSTEELVGEVRRVVAGPKTWSQRSSIPPTLQRQSSLRLDTPVLDWPSPKLLPGGTHMIVYVSEPGDRQISGFEYWEVHTGRRVWKWGREDYAVIREVSDLRRAKIVVFIVFSGRDAPQNYHALIVEVDIASGESVEFPALPIDPILNQEPHLCGDFLIFPVLRRNTLLLLNWRTEEGFMFNAERIVYYALFPAHIVLAYSSPSIPHVPDLRVYAIASFYDLWGPLSDLIVSTSHRTDLSHIPFVACSVPSTNAFVYSHGTTPISVTRSPLHDTSYDCIVEVKVKTPPPRPASLIKRLRNKLKRNAAAPPAITSRLTKKVFHYELTFPPNVATTALSVLPQFRLISTWRVPGHPLGTTTYAGYSMCYETGPQFMVVQWTSDNETEEVAPVRFPGGELPRRFQLTRSGGLLEVRQNCVVVSYYQ
ncbi:hypothetical protein DFH06DRAFT_1312613 [Mycena polygramma]|nr:hypothetical protein DFH06DRAFT_1312613 [Mycena polygramma]